MAFASGLPVSALSYGSGLKNSIAPATREMVWRLLFMRKLPGGDIQP
jgi:flagellar biosynthesis protein FlhF